MEAVGDNWIEGGRSINKMKEVWHGLKRVKKVLKQMHKKNYGHMSLQIDKAREELHEIQNKLSTNPSCSNLHQAEKFCTLHLQKFMQVEESILKQKARVQWLKLGDSNSHFFFHAMKERYLQNSMEILQDEE